MADEDLYLDDAYAFLLQQTRLQQHRHHNLTPNSKLAMKQGKLTNKTANKAMLAQSQLARLHQELLHQQQSHSNDMAAMSTTLGYDATEVSNEHTNNAAMATAAAALSLCALDGSQPLLLQNVPQAVNTLPKLPPRIIKILCKSSPILHRLISNTVINNLNILC